VNRELSRRAMGLDEIEVRNLAELATVRYSVVPVTTSSVADSRTRPDFRAARRYANPSYRLASSGGAGS